MFKLLNIITATWPSFNSMGFFFFFNKNTSIALHFQIALKPLMQSPNKPIKLEVLWFGTGIHAKGELHEKSVGWRQNAAALRCDYKVDLDVFEGQK